MDGCILYLPYKYSSLPLTSSHLSSLVGRLLGRSLDYVWGELAVTTPPGVGGIYFFSWFSWNERWLCRCHWGLATLSHRTNLHLHRQLVFCSTNWWQFQEFPSLDTREICILRVQISQTNGHPNRQNWVKLQCQLPWPHHLFKPCRHHWDSI